jgi:chromosomal replication initiation ATPase DnaA
MSSPRQLVLPFPSAPDLARPDFARPDLGRPDLAWADFLEAPSNQHALVWLDRTDDWPARRLAIWGQSGCGKTHLAHRWAARRGARVIPGSCIRGPDDLAAGGGIAIDDADLAGANTAGERALLHGLNAAAEAGLAVLLTGRTPPARWHVPLADLASRLRAVTAVEIGPPDDSLLRALLARLLAERQLAVPRPVQDWLLLRLPRTQPAIRQAVARLDRLGMDAGRSITRALAARLLAETQNADPFEDGEILDPLGTAASCRGPILL